MGLIVCVAFPGFVGRAGWFLAEDEGMKKGKNQDKNSVRTSIRF